MHLCVVKINSQLKTKKMKKSLIIIGLMYFSLGTSVQAQDDSREDLSFGVKAGLNYSNVWDEQGQDFAADAKVGFAGGLFLGIPIGKFLGFQPEVLISQKGLQGSGTLYGSPYSFTRTTTYVDVPLQLQVKPADFLTIVVGPQYSYLMSERNVYTWGANSSVQEEDFENDNIRKNIFGVVAGGDINLQHIVLSGRMGWDLQTNHGDGSSSTPRYKNKWVQFTVGFKI